MRTHIAKSLQTRCQAIRNAVTAYNKAALELNPPKPTLDWSHVSHYTFLKDFVILRNMDRDICEKPWAKAVIREMIKQDQKVKRAQEEIIHCNVEEFLGPELRRAPWLLTLLVIQLNPKM
ncbi:hypothetical protein C0992_010209 [Termitomyces sp. T32_za158]|nr:hypothetical protein C0992_010209 [Termitomyces sp. T32_za158]